MFGVDRMLHLVMVNGHYLHGTKTTQHNTHVPVYVQVV